MSESDLDRREAEPFARGAARLHLARLAIIVGAAERIVTTAASFLRIPLLLWGLSLHDYGLWTAILGIVAAAYFLDFGLHFGLVNAVSAARGRDDPEAIARAIATAFLTYTAIAGVAALALVPTVAVLPLTEMLSVGRESLPLLREVALLGFGSLILSLPLRVHAASLTGSQEQWIVSLFRSAQSVFQLGALAVAFKFFHAGLRGVAWVGLISELASWGVLALWVEWRRNALRVRPRLASRAIAPMLLATGMTFLTINLANLFKMSLGSTIVAWARGPEEVGTLSVPLGLFTAALGLGAIVGASLWPAYGEAAIRGDWDWIARAFAFGAKISLGVAAGFSVLGAFFAADIVRLFAEKAGIPGLALTLALGIWLLAQTAISAASSLLNGMGRLRAVTAACVAEGLVVLFASMAAAGAWGATGVAAVMAAAGTINAAYLLFVATPRTTAGRVPPPIGAAARVLGCAGAASVIAFALSSVLAGSNPIVRLVVGAAPTALVLAASMWLLVLTPSERVRLRSARAARSSPA